MKQKQLSKVFMLSMMVILWTFTVHGQNALELKGIIDFTVPSGGSDGKAIHLIANENIADLSVYAIGVANNGGGSDSIEYRLPVQAASAGDDILLVRSESAMNSYFGDCISNFEHVITADDAISQNGDDAIELFMNTSVIETFGDINVDGTGQPWEYLDSWAFKVDGTWTYGAVNCTDGSTTMADASCPYPVCGYQVIPDALEIKGVMALSWNTSGTNGGKAVHLKAKEDIADLSVYAIGVANNGGGTDSIEYRLPAMAVAAGDDILLAREDSTLSAYFGGCAGEFEHVIQTDAMNQNGDDAIELFGDTTVIETFGDVNVDATGEAWEYAGSWAFKDNDVWMYGGVDCANGSNYMANSSCPYPMCDFSAPNALELKGIIDFTVPSGGPDGKAIHLFAKENIEDLSTYAIGVANNGGGSDSIEYRFPMMPVSAGEDILLVRSDSAMGAYFGDCFMDFEHVITSNDAISQNGDDAIELFGDTTVIETFGDINIDGTGEAWEYTDSWAFKMDGNWIYGGVDCTDGTTTMADASCNYPMCAEGYGDVPMDLELKGIIDFTVPSAGSDGKAIHFVAKENIPDLSQYAIGIANNGGGTDSIEYRFPIMAVGAGEDILLVRSDSAMSAYFGGCISQFEHIITSNDAVSQNGDDAIELFSDTTVIETFGDINVDGTGEIWEYTDSWAYKMDGNWIYGGVDCTDGTTTMADAACPYPICTDEPGEEKQALEIKGVMALLWNTSDTNGGKAVHLRANEDIADLSMYAIGVANNGGGSDSIEYRLPVMSVSAGDDILLAREDSTIQGYFGDCAVEFEHVIQTDAINQNGDDAIELYADTTLIETFGDANVDGTGEMWEYTGSWAYKTMEGWMFGGLNCAANDSTMAESACPYPMCDFAPVVEAPNGLEIKGVMALLWTSSGTNGGKAVHLRAKEYIPDLSVYAIGVANNGGGSDSIEFRLPMMSVSAGDDILLAREDSTISGYFGGCANEFEYIIQTDAMNQNGDDAIELFGDTTVIETYGDANVDGTGEAWEYSGSWAYKDNDTWTYGGVDCAANDSIMSESSCPYPLCDFTSGNNVPHGLELKGVMALLWTTSGTNGGKAIHLKAKEDITDLSVYAIGVANNGGGSDSIEYRFPVMSVAAGDDILLAREDSTLSAYFGTCAGEFEHILQTDEMNQNGDDAIELYSDTTVIETYGDANVDGSGQLWEYSGSWAYKDHGIWMYGSPDCAATSDLMENSVCPYPMCGFVPPQREERSVLFLGNSYTFYNDMPKIVQDLAASVGDVLVKDENTVSSYTFEDHLSDGESIGKMKQGGWDYVVLQEQSTRPVKDISLVETQTFAKAAELDSIREMANPVGDVMFYMTWGRKNSYDGMSFNEMNDLLRERYRTMQSNQNGLISPVGAVWRYVRDNHSGLELYDPDESHPSNIGSYLSAVTFYTSIFQKDPTALNFDFDLSADDAKTIRAAVKAVVFDSLSYWNEYKPLKQPNISVDFDNLEDGSIALDTATLDFSVSASSSDSQIDEVIYLANGDTVATVTSAPYSPSIELDGIGNFTIAAIAKDANGGQNYAVRNITRTPSDVAKDLELVGVLALRWSTEPGGNSGKAVHLRALADIPDLSVYGIGVANNGGGTDGLEYNFPSMSVMAGDDILLAREDDAIAAYFGDCANEIEHVIQSDEMNQNGNDAIELFSGITVIETFGDANVDGIGQDWEYTGSWAYKEEGTWIYGGVDCGLSSTSIENTECPYPLCVSDEVTDDASLSDLQVDGTTIDGFVSGLLNYAVELPANQTTVPVVTATTNDPNATAEVIDATELPGVTNVVVTAVDGTTQQTYTIVFSLADGGGETVTGLDRDDFRLFIQNGQLNILGGSIEKVRNIEIYSMSGKRIAKQKLNNDKHAEMSVPLDRVLIIRMSDEKDQLLFNKKLYFEQQ